MKHPGDTLARLARDMRVLRRTHGGTPTEILAQLDGSPQLFDALNLLVQWKGWNGGELSEFECGCFGTVALHVSATAYATENFLFGEAADDASPMIVLLRAASPPLADHFGQLLDVIPGYRGARNHVERQQAFATDDEEEQDLWVEQISRWTRTYIAKPYVSDRDVLHHVGRQFREIAIVWPQE